jgi:hypothetical protein
MQIKTEGLQTHKAASSPIFMTLQNFDRRVYVSNSSDQASVNKRVDHNNGMGGWKGIPI